MSFIKQRPFQPSENTKETKKKIKKATNASRFVSRTANAAVSSRRRFEEAKAHKNEPSLGERPMYRSMYADDGFRRRDDMHTFVGDGSGSFARTAKTSDDIRYIPGMTVGLEYVLRELGIDTVSQMLAKLLSYVDGVNEPMEVLNAYYLWFKEISKGTIASETNFHTCVHAMGQYAVECGLLEDYE